MANRISFYNDDDERPVRLSWRHRRGAQIAAIALLAVFAITSAVLIIKFSGHKGFLGQKQEDGTDKDALAGDSSVYSNDRMMTDDIANSENVHLRRGRDSYLKGYLNDAYAEFQKLSKATPLTAKKLLPLPTWVLSKTNARTTKRP